MLEIHLESAMHLALALIQACLSDNNLLLQLSYFIDELKKLKKKGKLSTCTTFEMQNCGVTPFNKNDEPPLSKVEAEYKWRHRKDELLKPERRNRDHDAITHHFGCPQPPVGDGAGCFDGDVCIFCDHKIIQHQPNGIDKLPNAELIF